MRIAFLLLLAAIIPLQAADKPAKPEKKKKVPPITLRLYAEGNPKSGERFVTPITLIKPAKQVFVSKVPIVTEKDIIAFYPFQGADGSLSAYFLLDAHGTNKLQQFSTEARGTISVLMIRDRVACAMNVEQPIKDNVLYVASGLLPDDLVELQERFPIVGREKDFKSKKVTWESFIPFKD